jgi:hypothetical protein
VKVERKGREMGERGKREEKKGKNSKRVSRGVQE